MKPGIFEVGDEVVVFEHSILDTLGFDRGGGRYGRVIGFPIRHIDRRRNYCLPLKSGVYHDLNGVRVELHGYDNKTLTFDVGRVDFSQGSLRTQRLDELKARTMPYQGLRYFSPLPQTEYMEWDIIKLKGRSSAKDFYASVVQGLSQPNAKKVKRASTRNGITRTVEMSLGAGMNGINLDRAVVVGINYSPFGEVNVESYRVASSENDSWHIAVNPNEVDRMVQKGAVRNYAERRALPDSYDVYRKIDFILAMGDAKPVFPDRVIRFPSSLPLMKEDTWDFEKAVQFVRSGRAHAWSNIRFSSQSESHIFPLIFDDSLIGEKIREDLLAVNIGGRG